MGRAPCCDKDGLKKGPWLPEEDQKLIDYIQKHGPGNWRNLPKKAGLQRCGKSCRLRWTNYLRPDIKRGRFSFEEEEAIIQLHSILGNKWSAIAAKLPGRTDNEIKNYWNTHIRKRLLRMGIDPVTHTRRLDLIDHLSFPSFLNSTIENNHSNDQLNLLNLLSLQSLMNPDILSLATLLSTTQNHKLEFLLNSLQSNNPTTTNNSNQMQHQFNPILQTQHNACSGSVSNLGHGTVLNNEQVTKPTFDQYPTHITNFDTQNCTNQMENNAGLAQVCTNNCSDFQTNQKLNFGDNQQVLMEKLLDDATWKWNNNSNDQSLFLPSLFSSPSSSQQQTYPTSSSSSEEDEIDSYCQKLMNFDFPVDFFDGCKS